MQIPYRKWIELFSPQPKYFSWTTGVTSPGINGSSLIVDQTNDPTHKIIVQSLLIGVYPSGSSAAWTGNVIFQFQDEIAPISSAPFVCGGASNIEFHNPNGIFIGSPGGNLIITAQATVTDTIFIGCHVVYMMMPLTLTLQVE
jgi:hypothetical protein